jgi:hypothetical protein
LVELHRRVEQNRYRKAHGIAPEDEPTALADWLALEIRGFGQPPKHVAAPESELD